MANWQRRLEVLKAAHKHQHAIVESLEAEKAPHDAISSAKKKKLQLKDQITEIEMQMKVK
jgi:hypothetical protein